MHAASGNRVLYTGGGFAGGITGCNEVGGELEVVTMNGSVTAANGEAGGVTAITTAASKRPGSTARIFAARRTPSAALQPATKPVQ